MRRLAEIHLGGMTMQTTFDWLDKLKTPLGEVRLSKHLVETNLERIDRIWRQIDIESVNTEMSIESLQRDFETALRLLFEPIRERIAEECPDADVRKSAELEACLDSITNRPVAFVDECFQQAASNGDLKRMSELLDNRANLESCDRADDTPLILAVRSRNTEAVRFLLAHGAGADSMNRLSGTSPLHHAAGSGEIGMMSLLLDNAAEIEMRNHSGKTPLFHAVCSHNPAAVEYLLMRGADVNACDSNGSTPLHLATSIAAITPAWRPSTEIMAVLLEAGADPELKDANGKTPLDYALETNANKAAQLLRESEK